MKKIINILIMVFIFFSSCVSFDSIQESICLHSVRIAINIPCKMKKQVINYAEGVLCFYSLPTGEVIEIQQGALMKSQIDDLVPFLKKRKKRCYIEKGIDGNGKLWRMDVYAKFKIYYFGISPSEVQIYDGILNKIKIKDV